MRAGDVDGVGAVEGFVGALEKVVERDVPDGGLVIAEVGLVVSGAVASIIFVQHGAGDGDADEDVLLDAGDDGDLPCGDALNVILEAHGERHQAQ